MDVTLQTSFGSLEIFEFGGRVVARIVFLLPRSLFVGYFGASAAFRRNEYLLI